MNSTANQTCFPNFGVSLEEKTDRAIALLREHEAKALELSPDGYWLAFSGGKDSCVIKELARLAGVKHRKVYSQTTIDPPELIRFIKQYHAEVEWRRPQRNFFRAIIDIHGLPNRIHRWCCEEYKESGGDGMIKILGVRAAESVRRKKRWAEITDWRSGIGGFVVAPIVYWQDEDVWKFIRTRSLPYCSLYDDGFKRIGCIGCPQAGDKRYEQFQRWPGFEKAWRNAATKYWERTHVLKYRDGTPYTSAQFKTGEDLFNWWLSGDSLPDDIEEPCLGLYDE